MSDPLTDITEAIRAFELDVEACEAGRTDESITSDQHNELRKKSDSSHFALLRLVTALVRENERYRHALRDCETFAKNVLSCYTPIAAVMEIEKRAHEALR